MPHMFTKTVMGKQDLRERYIKLMYDAERAVGREEAIYLFRDAEIIWKRLTVDKVSFGRSRKIDFNY